MLRFCTVATIGLVSLCGTQAGAQAQTAPPPATTPLIDPRFGQAPAVDRTRPTADVKTGRRRAEPIVAVDRLTLDSIDPASQDFNWGRPYLRLFTDFTLKSTDTAREIVVVLGNLRVEGRITDDVLVIGGTVTLAPTAVIEDSLVVFGGNVKVESGCCGAGHAPRSIVIIGGAMDAPADFSPRGEQVIFGSPEVGDSFREVVPWVTRGLLWGRLLVPRLGWNWMVVLVSFLIGLVLNHIFSRHVGACAEVLARRPVSSFLTGLLALCLAPPLLVIVAASVIGLIVLPFAIAAFIAAGMIGKIGVARAIGRSVITESDPENRGEGARSFTIGAAIMTLAYMVPLLGILTWAMAGIFGLGAATMSLAARLKRERPVPPPIVPPVAPPEPPPAPPTSPLEPAPYAPSAAASSSYGASSFAATEPPPLVSETQQPPPRDDAPPPQPPPVVEAVPPFRPAPPMFGGLAMYPRAGFLDRVAAFALDIVLIAIVISFMSHIWRDEGPFLILVLAYHVGFWAWKGTTLGGIICNLRVVRTNGENPRFIDALVRGLSSIFSIAALGIGCLWMINDAERQMWHDKIAGTVVVKLPRELVLT